MTSFSSKLFVITRLGISTMFIPLNHHFPMVFLWFSYVYPHVWWWPSPSAAVQVQFGRKSVWAFAAAREHTEATRAKLRSPRRRWENQRNLAPKKMGFHGNWSQISLGFHWDFIGISSGFTTEHHWTLGCHLIEWGWWCNWSTTMGFERACSMGYRVL